MEDRKDYKFTFEELRNLAMPSRKKISIDKNWENEWHKITNLPDYISIMHWAYDLLKDKAMNGKGDTCARIRSSDINKIYPIDKEKSKKTEHYEWTEGHLFWKKKLSEDIEVDNCEYLDNYYNNVSGLLHHIAIELYNNDYPVGLTQSTDGSNFTMITVYWTDTFHGWA